MNKSSMQVRLFKPKVCEQAVLGVAEVLRSGWLGMGPKTAEFEKAIAAFLGVPRAVAVNTCTSALHLAVKLLQLEKGREVITTPVTFVATNEVLLYEGLKPVFADVDPRTGNLTPETVAARLTPRTGAIMLTHMAGYACDLEGFRRLASLRSLPVIEDCAHACGAKYKGARVGASGNLCAFSFDAIKNLTTGDGGMLIVRNAAEEQRARNLRNMGLTKTAFQRVNEIQNRKHSWEYEVPEVGYRYHMNDIQAAMGLAQLQVLDAENARRREIAARYDRLLGKVAGVRLPEYKSDRECSYHIYAILAENRNALAEKLGERGVIVGVHYSRNDLYPIFRRAEVPNADYFCTHVLSLPMHLDLTNEEIDYVCNIIREGW